MVILIAIATFLSTLLGGLFALRLRDKLHLILGFSAGAVIGVAFFDLIPEALTLIGSSYDVSMTTTLVALGFALYLILDRIVILHRHHENSHHRHVHTERGVWGAGTLSTHSFLDGLGIGLAFKVSPAIGLVVAAAVLAHDFSDGINTVSMILKNGGGRERALRWLLIDAIAPVFGVLVTLLFSVSEQDLGMLLALFAGFFLYIGSADLLPESHHEHPKAWTTVATALGMLVMFVVVRLAV